MDLGNLHDPVIIGAPQCYPRKEQINLGNEFLETWLQEIEKILLTKLATVVEGYPKTPFSIATTPKSGGGRCSFPWNAPLYPWNVPYNAECWPRRYQVPLLSLWYASTWDWTPVSRPIGEHSTSWSMGRSY